MGKILFDVFEINIAVSIVILLVALLAEFLRKRYGAGWLRIVWILLAVRLLIPYNFSLQNMLYMESNHYLLQEKLQLYLPTDFQANLRTVQILQYNLPDHLQMHLLLIQSLYFELYPNLF